MVADLASSLPLNSIPVIPYAMLTGNAIVEGVSFVCKSMRYAEHLTKTR